jgi:hypothetical protein
VFGSSPPVTVVAEGLDSGVTLGDSEALGVVDALADALAEADGVALAEAEGVALGTAAAQASFVMVFVSRVTAPSRANSWPLKVAPVFAVIDAIANT